MGPINGATLDLALGTDNTYTVYLNGNQIGQDLSGDNFTSADHITSIPAGYFVQGTNVLKFVVTNLGVPGSDYSSNPAGLIYKFTINGNCKDDYFAKNCQLWNAKDLTSEHFWNLDDVKPGDKGTNLISLHIDNNDAWACMMVNNKQDDENGLSDSETDIGDITANMGELSQFINVFGWEDDNQDGIYQISETTLFQGSLADPIVSLAIADANNLPQISGNTTKYLGLAWCFGNQNVDTGTGAITCDGSSVGDIAQTDSFVADLTMYATQYRNQENFLCSSLSPNQLINGGFENGTTGWAVSGQNAVVNSYTTTDGAITTYNPIEGNNFLVLTAGAQNVYTIASQQVTLATGQKLEGWAAF